MSKINYRKDQIPIMNYENGTMAVPAVPGAGKTFIVTNLVTKLLAENKNEKGINKRNMTIIKKIVICSRAML